MKGRGPRCERETIIILNEQSEEATTRTSQSGNLSVSSQAAWTELANQGRKEVGRV
jgi:hypothetical protein